MSENRIRTGILGLDDLIEGGLPKGFSYAVIGGPGTGKTTFAVQYLYKGAKDFSEPGLYVTFDEPPYSIINNVRRFNWNILEEEKVGRVTFVDASPIRRAESKETFAPTVLKYGLGAEKFSINDLITLIRESSRKINAQRCVIDSLSALTWQFRDEFEMRRQELDLMKELTGMGLTTLLLTENIEDRPDATRFGPEAFLAQGVIVLHMFRIEDSNMRALEIRKMRGVKHIEKLCPYRITGDGIEVYPEENVFRS